MANNSGNNPQPGKLTDLAFHLHDLKQLTEQLSELAESMQQASAAGDGIPGDPNHTVYGYGGA